MVLGRSDLTEGYYDAWGDALHPQVFDHLAHYPNFLLKKHFESFNEVRLLRQVADNIDGSRFFEIGCATGAFYRYISRNLPRFQYSGFDISEPSVALAVSKFGDDKFQRISGVDEVAKNHGSASVVFCRDVVLHQVHPFDFMDTLLGMTEECLVMRLRTRDTGTTVLDPDASCQRHYGRYWVPYIVLNTDEMVDRISANRNVHSITVSRRHEVLGGFNGRYLPKELHYAETGGAETAVLVRLGADRKGRSVDVQYDDRRDGPTYSLWERVVNRLSRMITRTRVPSAHPEQD